MSLMPELFNRRQLNPVTGDVIDGWVDPEETRNANPEGRNQYTTGLVGKHVRGEPLTDTEKGHLAGHAQASQTSRPQLERVVTSDPRHEVGEVLHLGPTSFTGARLSKGENAGHIAVKYSDSAVYRIERPGMGRDVDYTGVDTGLVSPGEEAETIVAGPYQVSKVSSVEHPGRMGRLKVYHLSESRGT